MTPRYSRYYHPDLADKMEARVAFDPATGCWKWTKGVNADGYGYGIYIKGRQVRAHRAAFYVSMGILPEPQFPIRHLCSNPGCCRPDHLAVGTAEENAQDAVAAGRFRGSRKSFRQRKADALAILSDTGTAGTLAERYGVSLSTVSRVRRRAKPQGNASKKLTESDVRAIRKSDEPNKVLAGRYGVTAPNIHAIRLGRTWRHVS